MDLQKETEGIDYFDPYAPMSPISTIRLLIALALIYNMIIRQMDVKKTFLNGELDEKVYMNQPQGFIMPKNENKYSKVIGCLMYAMTCIKLDIAFVVGKLSRYTSNPVVLLGGGAISWASKKQTCITSSTMEYEFIALTTAGKEAEWLRNPILKILLWSKPIAPISISCDSVATLARSYSQTYRRF
ncbi:zinc finger, CCHC-type containing protein [Tanacetum coccineum]